MRIKLAKLPDKKLLVLVAVVLAGGLLLLAAKSTSEPIPRKVLRQAVFSVSYPKAEGVSIDKGTVKYDKDNHAVAYDAQVAGKKVTITEQATPDIFSEGPVYDFKLKQAHEYESFDSAAGHVSLTKPNELHGQTLAWVNAGGTLTLVRSHQELTLEQWKKLFEAMRRAG